MLKRYRKFRERFVSDLPRYRVIASMTPRGSVLDYGCGEGYLGQILLRQGCEVTGCDISPELLENCPFPTRTIDLNKPTGFLDNEFDTVIASDVIEHIRDPIAALNEMNRIARNYVIISIPNSSGFFLYRLFPSLESPEEKYSPHLHHWGRDSFPTAGMEILELKNCTDILELRFVNFLGLNALSQTLVMKFKAEDR